VFRQRKPRDGFDKRLANLWSRKKITKTPTLFVGKKIYIGNPE